MVVSSGEDGSLSVLGIDGCFTTSDLDSFSVKEIVGDSEESLIIVEIYTLLFCEVFTFP